MTYSLMKAGISPIPLQILIMVIIYIAVVYATTKFVLFIIKKNKRIV